MPSRRLFKPNGRVGTPVFLDLKTSQAYYGPDPKGESGSMKWRKVGIQGQETNFLILLQSSFNVSYFLAFLLKICIGDLKIFTKSGVISSNNPVFKVLWPDIGDFPIQS